jgi:hypothetical protein
MFTSKEPSNPASSDQTDWANEARVNQSYGKKQRGVTSRARQRATTDSRTKSIVVWLAYAETKQKQTALGHPRNPLLSRAPLSRYSFFLRLGKERSMAGRVRWTGTSVVGKDCCAVGSLEKNGRRN